MLDFLKTIFGDNITAVPYDCPEKMPYGIRDNSSCSACRGRTTDAFYCPPVSLPVLTEQM